jgi:hypothetical protein
VYTSNIGENAMTLTLSRSLSELQFEMNRLVENAQIEYSKLPAVQVAEKALESAEPDVVAQYGRVLLLGDLQRRIRAVRLKEARAARPQFSFPGLEKLPPRITVADGTRCKLQDARITQLRAYLKVLNRQHKDRRSADPRIVETKSLIKVVTRHSRKHRNITVGEVAVIEAEKARKLIDSPPIPASKKK